MSNHLPKWLYSFCSLKQRMKFPIAPYLALLLFQFFLLWELCNVIPSVYLNWNLWKISDDLFLHCCMNFLCLLNKIFSLQRKNCPLSMVYASLCLLNLCLFLCCHLGKLVLHSSLMFISFCWFLKFLKGVRPVFSFIFCVPVSSDSSHICCKDWLYTNLSGA